MRRDVDALRGAMLNHEAYSKKVIAEMGVQRRVVCAADRRPDGTIVCAARHSDPRMHLQKALIGGNWDGCEQGFIDQWSVFMDRLEAWQVALAAGQSIRRVGNDDMNGGTLYSENLY